MKQVGVFYFILLVFLIIVAYYVGFSEDVLAFIAAASRVIKELTVGQFPNPASQFSNTPSTSSGTGTLV